MASQFPPILSAVKTVLAALSGAPTCVIRKRDVVKARDALPICVVSYGRNAPTGWATTGNGTTDLGTIGKVYSVNVSVYRENRGDQADSATDPDFIDLAQHALNTGTLSGVSTVWTTELVPFEEWEDSPFRDGVQVARFGLLFDTAESRIG